MGSPCRRTKKHPLKGKTRAEIAQASAAKAEIALKKKEGLIQKKQAQVQAACVAVKKKREAAEKAAEMHRAKLNVKISSLGTYPPHETRSLKNPIRKRSVGDCACEVTYACMQCNRRVRLLGLHALN